MIQQILLNGITVEELLEKIGQLFDKKIEQSFNLLKRENPKPNETVTRKEAAKILKISLPTLAMFTKVGILKSYRIGTRRIVYKRDEVDEALILRQYDRIRKGGNDGTQK